MPEVLQAYGQDRPKRLLELLLRGDHPPHALLFTGPDGVGKKHLALQAALLLTLPKEKREAILAGEQPFCPLLPFHSGGNVHLIQDASQPLALRRNSLLEVMRSYKAPVQSTDISTLARTLVEEGFLKGFLPGGSVEPIDVFTLAADKFLTKQPPKRVDMNAVQKALQELRKKNNAAGVLAGALLEALGGSPYFGTLKIEEVRENIIQAATYGERGQGLNVFIIDDAHSLNEFAENALLKVLEEPPARVMIILITSKEYDLLPTIRSRCQHLQFPPLSDAALLEALERHHGAESEGREVLAAMSQGSLARALRLDLDSLLAGRENLFQRFLALKNQEPDAPLRFAGELIGPDREERAIRRRRIGESLAVLLSWIRDCLVSRETSGGKLIHKGLSEEIGLSRAATNAKEALEDTLSIGKALETLETNVDERLMLEVLALDLARSRKELGIRI